jgi:ATP-binding cassette subfamily F protein uup
MDAEGLTKGYDERVLVRDLDIRVMRGDRLGIVGPNGAGKTTLIKMLTGVLAPDSGTIKLGTNIELASLDQRRASLGPETTLQDALTGGGTDQVVINGQGRHVITYMKDFLFAPEQAGTALKKLSGGERARVMLARALALPSNLLVLDEPTNDLDLETLDLLQEMIADYPGTVIVVSHDRDFLDRVATSVLAFEGDGHWTEYAGGYADMIAQRRRTTSAPPPGEKQKPAVKPNQPASSPDRQKKLSFNQQHALKTLPGRMEKLQGDIAALEKKLADPELYVRNPDQFASTSTALEAAQEALEVAETEWLELEMLKEKLDN